MHGIGRRVKICWLGMCRGWSTIAVNPSLILLMLTTNSPAGGGGGGGGVVHLVLGLNRPANYNG